MKYFWIAIIVITIILVQIVNSSRSEVKLFCSYGRVFIEFHEGGTVWGTMWLSEDGTPVMCEDKIKTRLKDTI